MQVMTLICSKEFYHFTFKISIFLITIALVALSHNGPLLYEQEASMQSKKIALEVATNTDFEHIDCKDLSKDQKTQYEIAKYELQTVTSMTNLFETVIDNCMFFAIMLLSISIASFFGSYFSNQSKEDENIQAAQDN